MEVADAPPETKKGLELSIAELRESLAAVGEADEATPGTYADKLKLQAVSDPQVLRALAAALRGRSADAEEAARTVRSLAITPEASVAVCKEGVAQALCSALGRRREPAVLAWALAALVRLAQHGRTHALLLRAGAVEATAAHSLRGGRAAAGSPQLDALAALGLALLCRPTGADVAARVPLRSVAGFVALLRRRLASPGAEEVVAACHFCGLPADYPPRLPAQALAQLLEASTAHVAVAWQTALPEVLSGILEGVFPNDTEANQPFGSPDVVEMAGRCRVALLARGASRSADPSRVAALRAAPGAPRGTWERRGGGAAGDAVAAVGAPGGAAGRAAGTSRPPASKL